MDNDLISRSALLDRLAFKRMGSMQRNLYPGLESAISQVKKAKAVDALLIPEEVDGKAVKFIWQKQDGTLVSYAPVVRCEDCKHWKQIRDDRGLCKHETFTMDDDVIDPITEPDDFCSYGERREDDGQ